VLQVPDLLLLVLAVRDQLLGTGVDHRGFSPGRFHSQGVSLPAARARRGASNSDASELNRATTQMHQAASQLTETAASAVQAPR